MSVKVIADEAGVTERSIVPAVKVLAPTACWSVKSADVLVRTVAAKPATTNTDATSCFVVLAPFIVPIPLPVRSAPRCVVVFVRRLAERDVRPPRKGADVALWASAGRFAGQVRTARPSSRVVLGLLGGERQRGGRRRALEPVAARQRQVGLEAECFVDAGVQRPVTGLATLGAVADELAGGRVEIAGVERRAVEVVTRRRGGRDVDRLDGQDELILQPLQVGIGRDRRDGVAQVQ